MIDIDPEKKIKTHNTDSAKEEETPSSQSIPKWGQIKKDMTLALSHWEEITKKYEGRMNKDELQLQEIKGLLKELKSKLDLFRK